METVLAVVLIVGPPFLMGVILGAVINRYLSRDR